MFVRNRGIFYKKREIFFYKKWKNVAPNNVEFQKEVDMGLVKLENELNQMES